MLTWLKGLHFVGLFAVIIGTGLLFFTEISQQVSGMMLIAAFIGVGLLIMAPFPVALVIEWAQKQSHQEPK